MPRVVMDWFWEHEAPISSPKEQSRIVELLDEADRLRRIRREADAKAARILPALFLKMFGDPATNPMGWLQGTLGEFGVRVRYGLGQPPKQSNSGLALLRATNIDAGRIVEKNLLFVDRKDVPPGRNAFLSPEEVLVVRSGAYTGDVAQVTDKWAGSVAGYDLVVTPAVDWSGEFVEQYLLTPFVQKTYFDSQKGRAGQPHLNSTQLEATPIFNPPTGLQNAFAIQVRAIRSLRDQCLDNAVRLEKLFDVLLQRAFSGQLTIKWREGYMQEILKEMTQQARALNLPFPKELEVVL
jgi:type I restriction enzyme S subunit